MPFPFILLILVTIVGVAALALSKPLNLKPLVGVGILVVLGLPLLLWSTVTTVPARSIGVVTSFGKPVDALDSGLHFKAPWEKVSDLDGKKQTTNFGGPGDSPYDTVSVRLGSEGTAEVQASVRWSITKSKDGATELFSDYREMDQITDSLIARETRSAVGKVFNSFNPLAKIEPKANADGGTLPTYDEFAQQVQDRLETRVGKYVKIDSVIIQYVKYDKGTQSKLNAYAAEVAETRVAQQREATAKAQARANRQLSGSISKDPNVLVKQCLDALDKMVDKGNIPPAGFTCWPGGSNVNGLIVK